MGNGEEGKENGERGKEGKGNSGSESGHKVWKKGKRKGMNRDTYIIYAYAREKRITKKGEDKKGEVTRGGGGTQSSGTDAGH